MFDMIEFIRKIKNIRRLHLFVQSVDPEFWKENPQLAAVVYDEYCRRSTDSTEFGTEEFWAAVLGDTSDTEQESPTAQATAEVDDEPTAQAPAEVDDEPTAQAPAEVDDEPTAQAPAAEDTSQPLSDMTSTAQATAVDDEPTAQAPAAEDALTVQASAAVDVPTAQAPAVDDEPTAQASAAVDTTETHDWLTEEEYDAMFGAGASASLPEPETSLPLSHFYTLDLRDEVRVKRFKTRGGTYEMKLKNLDEVSDVDLLLSQILESILKNIKSPGNTESTLLGISIDHSAMDKPFNIPFQHQRKVTSESVLRVIQKIMQSNKEVALDSQFQLRFVLVTPPEGKGDRKRKYCNDWSDWMKAHTGHGGCFVRIQSNDALCCARALVVARAKEDNDPEYENIRKDERTRHQNQKRLAQQLMKDTGLENHIGGCGIPELRRFQQVLSPTYQIKVFWKEGFNGLLFKGPSAPTVLSLYLHDEHYDVITSVPAFFDNRYYCHDCDKAYHTRHEHQCQTTCTACRQRRACPKDDDRLYCPDCNRGFYGAECFQLHKEMNVCAKVKRCKKCECQYLTEKGRHLCGTFWCRNCHIRAEKKGHACYIQPLQPNKKPNFETFIFFDFETSQDLIIREDSPDNRIFEHRVNACVVQKVCPLCKDLPLGDCPQCGPNQIIFKGPNTLSQFCDWLFNHRNKDCLALAHNAKAFDSQFILNHLQKQAVKPEIVCRGLKILCLEVGNIKIIDSLSFLPMPLSALPKAFNIKELKKGFFPHLFNKQENWDYVGAMPASDYYDPNNMKPKQRREFDTWYEENKTKKFDFKEELIAYCVSDVDILRKACLRFMEAFQEQTGVQPFDKAITIAQACQIVYRQNFLPKEIIALVPHGGYRWKDKFSATAIKWLRWKSDTENIRIRHALNGGEVRVGPYKVAGMAGNRVFEFNGCPFHGCHTCFPDREKKLPLCSVTVEEAYLRTLDRRHFIETQAFQVEEMWSCQLKAQLDESPEMKAFFAEQHLIEPLDPRDSFYGGRTNAVTLYHKAGPGEKINYADVCSLYPFICKYGKFPVGHPGIITEGFQPLETRPYEGLIKFTTLPPRGLLLPVLPFRSGQKLLFPLCRTCAESRQQDPCHHLPEDRAIEGV